MKINNIKNLFKMLKIDNDDQAHHGCSNIFFAKRKDDNQCLKYFIDWNGKLRYEDGEIEGNGYEREEDSLLFKILNGEVNISIIVEPIHCEINDLFKYAYYNNDLKVKKFEGSTLDYYLRSSGNMFNIDDNVSNEQIEYIIENMQSRYCDDHPIECWYNNC